MLAGTLQQHPLPRAPWTGPPRGAERGEGGGGPLCRAQPWQRYHTRCQDSAEPKPDHLEPLWPKIRRRLGV